MREFGIIGYPLEHSHSPGYFADKFLREGISDTVYEAFPLKDISELPALLESHPALLGFNVTSPHKTTILPYLDSLSHEAVRIGAVNCVVRHTDKLVGYNTDYYGLRASLERFIGPERPRSLILGSGGAARAAAAVLSDMEIPHLTVSRNPHGEYALSYSDLDPGIISSRRLIINATPLGMFPAVEVLPPIPYEYLTPEHYLFDMIYNPAVTAFLAEGDKHGANTRNGLEMLALQAEKSWEIFNTINH